VGTVQYTPDGSKIIFTASVGDNDFAIYSVNAGGGALTRLTATGIANQYEEAWINLAGSKIVATRVSGGAGDIVTMDITNGGAGVNNITNVTNNPAEDFMPQWSKDGTKIVFSTDRNSGQFDIYWMNANGTNLALLAGDVTDEYGPSLNDAGTFVAYTVLSGDINSFGLYKKDTAGGLAGSLVLDSGIVQQVYWTPDPPPNRSHSPMGGVQFGRPMRPRLFRQ
jgi:Tol biopolymer transport system component